MDNPLKVYAKEYEAKKVIVVYRSNGRNSFGNHITVTAISNEQAIDKCKLEVAGVYGSDRIDNFTYTVR